MTYNQLQIAEALQINRVYVARLIKSGKIKGQKQGRAYKVTRANLEKFLGRKFPQKFYTLQEIALLLKLHRTFVSKLIRQKSLKTVQIGRFYRIAETDLKNLIKTEIPKKVFSIAELAQITHTARSNLVRAIIANHLKAIKLLTEYRISQKQAEEYFHISPD